MFHFLLLLTLFTTVTSNADILTAATDLQNVKAAEVLLTKLALEDARTMRNATTMEEITAIAAGSAIGGSCTFLVGVLLLGSDTLTRLLDDTAADSDRTTLTKSLLIGIPIALINSVLAYLAIKYTNRRIATHNPEYEKIITLLKNIQHSLQQHAINADTTPGWKA